jgi:hypothetical protein
MRLQFALKPKIRIIYKQKKLIVVIKITELKKDKKNIFVTEFLM